MYQNFILGYIFYTKFHSKNGTVLVVKGNYFAYIYRSAIYTVNLIIFTNDLMQKAMSFTFK